MKKTFVVGPCLLLLVCLSALGQPQPPSVNRPGVNQRVTRGVHINSVHVEGSCGQSARFIIEIQNNLNKMVQDGTVFVGSPNSPGNRIGNPASEFRNLAPGERRTITLASHWPISCTQQESAPPCYEVGIVMAPDNTANGEVWDHVWHRVCTQILKSGGVRFNDTTFTR